MWRHSKTGAKRTTLESEDPQFRGQVLAILQLFLSRKFHWIPVRELQAIATQQNARIFSLRQAGYTIENGCGTVAGRKDFVDAWCILGDRLQILRNDVREATDVKS